MLFLAIGLSGKFQYLENGGIFFWAACVENYQILALIKHMKKLAKLAIFDEAASLEIVRCLPEMAHTYPRRDTL